MTNNRTKTKKTKKKVCVSNNFVSWMTKLVFLFVCKWNCQSFNSYFWKAVSTHICTHKNTRIHIHIDIEIHIQSAQHIASNHINNFWLHTIQNVWYLYEMVNHCKMALKSIFWFFSKYFLKKKSIENYLKNWFKFISFFFFLIWENLCCQMCSFINCQIKRI